MMKRFLITFAVCVAAISGMAQDLKGTVKDTKGHPLALANVVLLQVKDSTFINGTTTANDGSFSIPKPNIDAFVRISFLGYQTVDMPLRENLGQITLEEDANLLSEVTVKSQLPQTILSNGGMTTNISGTILERAGTAEQMLNRLPNVTAKDGNIEVFGRGTPIIYINGRRMRESNELLRLSSEDIKKVEVITNPGARYEASATSVIRITTKPKAGDGFSLYSQSWLAREEAGLWKGLENLSLNYRKNGFDLGGTLYYNQWSSRDDKDLTTYTFLDKTWLNSQTARQRYDGKDFFAKLFASYAIDENNSFGISFSYDRYPENPSAGYISALLYENDKLSDNTLSTYKANDKKTSLNGNAYYVGKIGNVGIDFNTNWYYGKTNSWMNTTEETQTIKTETDTRNHLLASKLILSAPLAGGELSIGGEYSYSKRKTLYNVLPKDVLDDDNSRIEESMTSAFTEYQRTFGKLSLQAGLRYEYVDFNYYNNGVRIAEQSRTFSDLFPSLSLSMPVGKTQMMLTYSSDISRPSYWLLRSNATYGNRYTYEVGNPFLRPQVMRNLEYTLSYKWFTYTAMFIHMKNPIMSNGEIYKNQPSTILVSYINNKSYNLFYTNVSLQPKIGIWTPMLSLAVMKQWIDLTSFDDHSMNNPKATFRFNNTLETKLCDITLETFVQTEGADMNEYYRDGYFTANLSLRRALLKNRLTLQFDIKDLFHTGERTVRACYSNLQAVDMKNLHKQRISLTVTYNLNTTRSKYRGTGAGQSQKNRM